MEGQKIKQDEIHIGQNIRRIRLEKGVGQTELVRRLPLNFYQSFPGHGDPFQL